MNLIRYSYFSTNAFKINAIIIYPYSTNSVSWEKPSNMLYKRSIFNVKTFDPRVRN